MLVLLTVPNRRTRRTESGADASGGSTGSRLEIRSLSDGDGHVVILRERLTRIVPRALESLGLIRRQAEVLGWLAEGKANLETAAILTISPNTVARHVEAIFVRLGVQTRTAAAAAAFSHFSCS